MRGNVKTIKLAAWLSEAFAVITYFISIKGSLGVYELKWLPDVFLLAVFGGAFASMLVVLICEISKYYQNRESAETYLFSHLYYLYGRLHVISKNVDFLLAHKDNLHKDFLTQLIANAEAEMNAIYYADYAPFTKGNAVLAVKTRYNSKIFPVVQQFLQNCGMFETAVLTDKLNESQKKLGLEHGENNNAQLVLEKLCVQIQEPISLLDEALTEIDRLCNGRYQWTQLRDDLVKRLPDTRTDMLEDFLEKN